MSLIHVAVIPFYSVIMVSDACIAIALCVLLRQCRTTFKRSIALVNMLIVYAINRFVLTAFVVITQTSILIAKPDTDTWALSITFTTVHMYVNSFLATLNSRSHLRDIYKKNEDESIRIESTDVPTGNVKSEMSVTGLHTADGYTKDLCNGNHNHANADEEQGVASSQIRQLEGTTYEGSGGCSQSTSKSPEDEHATG